MCIYFIKMSSIPVRNKNCKMCVLRTESCNKYVNFFHGISYCASVNFLFIENF